ncbi:hypothetical protein CDA63_08580 [Hymenobacter amundsenii]|uniref:Outer membrane protein assembly factor BamE n=1 Tax=Hymenobacter amundsenii TaxID=2006685 RepID=A0A246FLM4_9BACT|nr:hypothetical protein [Hymenobacter amundsenii]OWP63623.1 hypothetical protein CDA63_08580 [Hymenobacter amundsenii]
MKNFWSDLLFYLMVGIFYALPVFALAFFVVRGSLRRFRPREPHPKRWALLTAGLATPLLCWRGVYLALFTISYYPHRDFNPHGWALNQDKRYEMVDELRASRRLIGLAPEQVATLLGKPAYQDKTSWTYYVGIRPGLGFSDGETLELEFQNNQVAQSSLRQH